MPKNKKVESTTRTTDGAINSNPGKVWSITLNSDGASAGTVVIKDGGSGGTAKWTLQVPATAGDSRSVSFPEGLSCPTSIYVDVTDIGSVCVAYTESA